MFSQTLVVLLICWGILVPVATVGAAWYLARRRPGNGHGRHVEAELRERARV
jgi:hypothetical protein